MLNKKLKKLWIKLTGKEKNIDAVIDTINPSLIREECTTIVMRDEVHHFLSNNPDFEDINNPHNPEPCCIPDCPHDADVVDIMHNPMCLFCAHDEVNNFPIPYKGGAV